MIRQATVIRLVIDTNVLLRAVLNPSSISTSVVSACEARQAIVLLSKPLLDEYREVLAYLRHRDESITEKQIETSLRRLRYVGDYRRQVHANFEYPRDPTDEKLLELAIDGDATNLVSYDADLLGLPGSRSDAGKRFRQRLGFVEIETPELFLRSHPELLKRK